MRLWLKSVKFKLTVLYSLVLVAVLVVFGLISWAFLSFGLFNNLEDSLAADFSSVKDNIQRNTGDDLPELLAELEHGLAGSLFVYDIASATLFGNHFDTDAVRAALIDFIPLGETAQIKKSPDGQFRMYIARYDQEAAPDRLLIITRHAGYIYDTLEDYKNVLYTLIPFVIVIAGVSGYFLASRSMKQVKVITATANGIDPADLKDRIPVRGNDELGQLSRTLNSSFDRIHGFIDRQRQFAADATHDLKAPLTNIKTQTEVALDRNRPGAEYRDTLRSIAEDTEQMESIVEDLLTLASLDTAPDAQHSTRFDLSNVAEDALDGWEVPCAAKGLTLARRIQPDIEITGEPLDFQRVLGNLLENAVKATSAGGVTVTMNESGGIITLTVTDTGIGIAPEHLQKIFWRFYRVDRHAKGNGLGLPIVQGIAEMYGGRVEVESEVGRGTVFRVVIPAQDRA
ncbi:phosphate regulon sensor protein PhoR [Dehalogenimonas sp. WBC-2]|nr:phosphate regulon sensor protein PhoR [Dehalogenimonas sp. WBC-2]